MSLEHKAPTQSLLMPGVDLSPPVSPTHMSCTDQPLLNATVPSNIYARSVPFPNATDYTMYDVWARTTTSILLTIFSNATSEVRPSTPFTYSHLSCSKPENVVGGSRVTPTSGAARVFGTLNTAHIAGWAFFVNLLVFLLL